MLADQEVLVEGAFDSGEAKTAFVRGRIEWSVALPESVRCALSQGSGESESCGGASLRIMGASKDGSPLALGVKGVS